MDADRFRETMALLPAGVVVAAARDGDGYRGLTATSFASVSIDPPLVLVALDRDTATRRAIAKGGLFAVSFLARGQEFIADRLSGRAPAADMAWSALPHRTGESGAPILEGCVGWLEARVVANHPAGDHDLVIGEVSAAGANGGEPLLLWNRAFWTIR